MGIGHHAYDTRTVFDMLTTSPLTTPAQAANKLRKNLEHVSSRKSHMLGNPVVNRTNEPDCKALSGTMKLQFISSAPEGKSQIGERWLACAPFCMRGLHSACMKKDIVGELTWTKLIVLPKPALLQITAVRGVSSVPHSQASAPTAPVHLQAVATGQGTSQSRMQQCPRTTSEVKPLSNHQEIRHVMKPATDVVRDDMTDVDMTPTHVEPVEYAATRSRRPRVVLTYGAKLKDYIT